MIEYQSTKQFDTYVEKEYVLGGNIEILQVQQLKCDRNFKRKQNWRQYARQIELQMTWQDNFKENMMRI